MAYSGKDTQVLKKKGVESWNSWRAKHPGMWPDLVGADLRGMDLRGVDFFTADLRSADLSDSNLETADLGGSILIWTNFTNANLRRVSLYMANMNGAILTGADLSYATMIETLLIDNDLRSVKGLDLVNHRGPSHIGLDTILKSEGEIPRQFLVRMGITDGIIKRVSTLEEPTPIYHSCVISHSSADDEFVQRLYRDLLAAGVRCWLALEDLKIGTQLRVSLDEAIDRHDKLLLVLSATSMKSQWVQQEVEKALDRERREDQSVLFPVRIDGAVFSAQGWAGLVKNARYIGDFTNWRNMTAYSKGLSRLLRDLRVEIRASERKPGA